MTAHGRGRVARPIGVKRVAICRHPEQVIAVDDPAQDTEPVSSGLRGDNLLRLIALDAEATACPIELAPGIVLVGSKTWASS